MKRIALRGITLTLTLALTLGTFSPILCRSYTDTGSSYDSQPTKEEIKIVKELEAANKKVQTYADKLAEEKSLGAKQAAIDNTSKQLAKQMGIVERLIDGGKKLSLTSQLAVGTLALAAAILGADYLSARITNKEAVLPQYIFSLANTAYGILPPSVQNAGSSIKNKAIATGFFGKQTPMADENIHVLTGVQRFFTKLLYEPVYNAATYIRGSNTPVMTDTPAITK